MSFLKQQFEQYTSEYLLEQRARGEDLSDEAHEAIEAVFRERNEPLPPRPARPVHIVSADTALDKARLKALGAALGWFGATVMAKVVLDTWLVVPVLVAIGAYYTLKLLRRANLPAEALADKDFATTAQSRGMTELMLCGATCDVARARDLLNFRPELDERDASGATALMYAARNGCVELTRLLVDAGADRSLLTPKGSNARDIALRHGHADVAALLEDESAEPGRAEALL
jgi:hypothetical protein